MIRSPLKAVSVVMLAVQIGSLCDPLTVATTHASPAAPRSAPTGLRSVTAAFLYDPEAASFQNEPAPTLAEQFADAFHTFERLSCPCDETARVPRAVSAILTPIVTPYGPVWVDAQAMEPLTAESDSQTPATRASGRESAGETPGASPDLNPFMIGAAPSAASAYGSPTAPAKTDLAAGPQATPDNEPDKPEKPNKGEEAPAPTESKAAPSKAAPTATTAAALNAHPEAAGATSTPRSSRSSFWMWTGSAVVVGLFVAGMSHDLSNDKSPPPEPPSLPDFPGAP